MSKVDFEDSGAYIVILRLEEDRDISVGRLGSLRFKKGYYLYTGSAKSGLSKRIERHKRKEKKSFWHIDYLREHTTFYKYFALRIGECEIASRLKKFADWIIPRFGCSDCRCQTHLFATSVDPLSIPSCIKIVSKFKIG
jgi:sugar fermentation stimulation protein A